MGGFSEMVPEGMMSAIHYSCNLQVRDAKGKPFSDFSCAIVAGNVAISTLGTNVLVEEVALIPEWFVGRIQIPYPTGQSENVPGNDCAIKVALANLMRGLTAHNWPNIVRAILSSPVWY